MGIHVSGKRPFESFYKRNGSHLIFKTKRKTKKKKKKKDLTQVIFKLRRIRCFYLKLVDPILSFQSEIV